MSLSGARTKAQDAAVRTASDTAATAIAACDISGGTVSPPNAGTAPTNPICSNDASSRWPTLPAGFIWDTSYLATDSNGNHLVYAYHPSNGKVTYAGTHANWIAYCNMGAAYVGLCRLSSGYGQLLYDPAIGYQ